MDDLLFGSGTTQQPVKHQAIVRLPVEGDLDSVYVYTETSGRELSLTLTDGLEAWNGRLTNSQLLQLARGVDSDADTYIKVTLEALTGAQSGTTFVYSVNKTSPFELKFSWKKQLREGIRFELGSVVVKKDRGAKQAHCSILDHLIGEVAGLKAEKEQLQDINSRLKAEHEIALSRLDECVNLKESLEKDLYEKFLLLLNSKKAKIRALLSQLSDEPSCGSNECEIDDEQSPPAEVTPSERESITILTAGPVKRRKRIATKDTSRSGPLLVPLPPPLKAPAIDESLESDKLLELL